MARRSLQASEDGIQAIKKALKKKSGGQTYLAGVARCSRQTIWKLLQSKAIDCDVFMAVCDELELNWEAVAKPEIPEPEQPVADDLTALVQSVRQHCFDIIEREHSQIQLLNRRKISVSHLYVDVYVLHDLSSETYIDPKQLLPNYDSQTDRLWLGERKHQAPESGVQIASEKARLMILGKPGSGKSTFLKYLAEACRQGEFCPSCIPVLIMLREVDVQDFDLLKLIQAVFDQELVSIEQTQQILQQGQVLILLDGLDEVPQALQRSVLDQIREFSRKYCNNKYILTCRTQTADYTLPNFDYVEVADFDEPKVTQFAKKWFAAFADGNLNTDLSETFLQKLRSPEQERTARLAVTPVLLNLVCQIYTDRQDLPTKRSELYKHGVEVLLKEWNKQQGVQRNSNHPIVDQLKPTDKQNLLSYLAFHKLEQPDNFTLFEQDEILKLIAEYLEIGLDDSEAVLQSIEAYHGLLIERASGYWSFSHLTFQEYFAARAIVESHDPEAIPNLVKHVTEKRWREVFLLTIEMLSQKKADELVRSMKQTIDSLGKRRQIQYPLDLAYQKFPTIETLLKLPNFQDAEEDEVRPWLPVIRAICLESSIEYMHDINLALAISEFAQDLDLGNVLEFSQQYKFYRAYSLAISFEKEIGNTPTNELDSLFDDFLAKTLRDILNPIKNVDLYLGSNPNPLKQHSQLTFWWNANSKSWNSKFSEFICKYKEAIQEVALNQKELSILAEYYDANKLLVDCLNLPDIYVSRNVREKIETTLLLPISVIENRRITK